jgi:hypothetical protein
VGTVSGLGVHRGRGVHGNARVVRGRFGEDKSDKQQPRVSENGRANGQPG